MAGESRRQRLRRLLRRAGVPGCDPAAVEAAFVHESAVREGYASASNERLEFLGDAILGLVIARWLFVNYPAASEGELALRKSALVSDVVLAASAERLEFGALLVLSAGLAKMPPARHRSTLGDAFEAFVAALYAAAGFGAVEQFIVREHVEPLVRSLKTLGDPKSVLQEWAQKHFARPPAYIDRADGPPHERVFHAEVWVEGESLAAGSGPSKKTAQRAAAENALGHLRERHDDIPSQPFAPPPAARRSRTVAARKPARAGAKQRTAATGPSAKKKRG